MSVKGCIIRKIYTIILLVGKEAKYSSQMYNGSSSILVPITWMSNVAPPAACAFNITNGMFYVFVGAPFYLL